MLLPQTPRNVFAAFVRNWAMRAPRAAIIGVLTALAIEPVRTAEGSRIPDAEATYGLAAPVRVAAVEMVGSPRGGEAPLITGGVNWHDVETWVAASYERLPSCWGSQRFSPYRRSQRSDTSFGARRLRCPILTSSRPRKRAPLFVPGRAPSCAGQSPRRGLLGPLAPGSRSKGRSLTVSG